MAIATALNIITKAFQKIGVLAEGETPNANQQSDGLDTLNLLIDSWAGDTLLTVAEIEENFPLVVGTPAYTIGTGQTFNTTKPFSITKAFVRDSNGYDRQLGIITRGIYQSYIDKDATGTPQTLFYDPGASQQANQAGTLKVYPAPNAADTLYITSEKPFTEFSTVSDTVTFYPAYKRALIYNLAIELAPDYGVSASPEVIKIAKDSKELIENINSRNKNIVAEMSLPGSHPGYNIFTDE